MRQKNREIFPHTSSCVLKVQEVCIYSVKGTLQRSSPHNRGVPCCEQRKSVCEYVCVTAYITLYPQGWLLPTPYSLYIHLLVCVHMSMCPRLRTDAIIILT